jgi:hypothetical protein
MRSLAERGECASYATEIAVVLVAIAASATRKTDGSLKTFWWICDQCYLCKSSGGDTSTQNRLPVHFRQAICVTNGGSQVVSTGFTSRLETASSPGVAVSLLAIHLSTRTSIPSSYHHDSYETAPGEP